MTLLVTGATSGIGRAVALAALRDGRDVVAVGRDEAALAVLADAGVRRVVRADLERPEGRARVRAAIVEAEVTTLVHAAGQAVHAAVNDIDPELLRAHFELHVVAGFELARAVATRSAHASCLFFGSTLSTRPVRDTLAYAVAKGGLEALVRALAVEFAPRHRVNAIELGVVDTPMIRGPRPDGLSPDDRVAALTRLHALDRLVEVEHVAATALHVLDAPSMTGSVVRVDAGLTVGR